jgi:hypothetical protein
VNWCQRNALGAANLDAYFDPNERKYFITPESVEVAITEEQAKVAKANIAAEPVGAVPKPSAPNGPESSAASDRGDEEVGRLRLEIRDLQITNRAKDMFIERLEQEQTHFEEERRDYIQQLITSNRKVGELETRLLALESPRTVAKNHFPIGGQ